MLRSRYNKENFVNIFENQRPKSILKEKCKRPRWKCTQRNALPFRMFSLRHHFRWQIDAFCAILEWSLRGHWRFETGNQKCCWYLPPQKPLGCSHLIFLDVNLNLFVLQRGNLLMTTAVLTLRSSNALWIFVYVIGLHAVQFGNNWMKKIPRTAKIGRGRRQSPIWLSEEFFESNYFQIGQACSPLTY